MIFVWFLATLIHQIYQSDLDRSELDSVKLDVLDISDDFYDYSKAIVDKPWGYEYLIFSNQNLAVWILYVEHGAQTSMHCHPNKQTSLVVLQGSVVCSTLSDSHSRTAGEGLLIDKGVFHQTTCVSKTGAFVMEIETPVNKRDLVRLKDRYGREKMGYESQNMSVISRPNSNYLSFEKDDFFGDYKTHFEDHMLVFKRLSGPWRLSECPRYSDSDIVCFLNGDSRMLGHVTTAGMLKSGAVDLLDQNSEILMVRKKEIEAR